MPLCPQVLPRTLIWVRTQRGLVDYALQRRALLASVRSGRTGVTEVCNASPYLVRAAKFHGVPTDIACPMCRKEPLTYVYWVYGDEIKHMASEPPSDVRGVFWHATKGPRTPYPVWTVQVIDDD